MSFPHRNFPLFRRAAASFHVLRRRAKGSDSFSVRAKPLLWAGLLGLILFALGARLNAGTLFLAKMSGASELPPTLPDATGLGVIIVNDAGTSSTITTNWQKVTAITGGRIHRGAANVNGPAIFPFATVGNPSAPFTWNLSATALNDMKNGGLYMDLTTAAFPDGVIRGQIFRATLAPAAANAVQKRLAETVLDVSAGFNADFDQILIQSNLSSLTIQTHILDELSAHTAYAPLREQIESMAGLTDSLFAHADEARLHPEPGAAQWRTFLLGGNAFGRRSASDNQAAAKVSRPFAAAGLDYRLGTQSRAGLAVGYANGRDHFESTGSRTETKVKQAQVFFSTALGGSGVALDGSAGYGWTTIDSVRQLPSLVRTAKAAFDGKVWSAALKASKPFKLSGETTLVPYALLDTQRAQQDAYTETGAGAANLVIPQLTSRNSGFEGGATLLVPVGGLSARLQVGWHHLFEDGSDTFQTKLEGSPILFDTALDGPGRNSAHIEAALGAPLGKHALATISYRGDLGAAGQTINAAEARVVFRF